MLSSTDLFNKVTGLNLQEGSEAELLSQINGYQKDGDLKSGVNEGVDGSSFEYCWDQMKTGSATPSKPIPGHHRPKHDKSMAKSPKSPKSPKTPKSPISGTLMSLSDNSLRELKSSLLEERNR